MVDPAPPELPQRPPAPDPSFYEKPVWKRLYAFVLGPALLAAAILAVFTLTSVLVAPERDPEELVRDLDEGGEHRRWQAAFALTQYLQPSVAGEGPSLRRESDAAYEAKLRRVRALVPRLLRIWNDPERGDPEIRRFLALAFSYLGDPRLLPALRGALTAADVELVHYALAAIATTADGSGASAEARSPQTMAAVLTASRRDEKDLRATAMFVLALLGGDAALDRLRGALEDPAPAVRWNAAFGLARHGDGAGASIIGEILDRGPIYREAGVDPGRRRDLFLNAVRSAGMVATPALDEKLTRIAASDPDLAARNEAMRLLEARAPTRGSGAKPTQGDPAHGED